VRNRAVSEVPLTSAAPSPVFVEAKAPVDSEPVQSSSPIATVQHQLDEALMRLELNSLELKEHLDDLDKKMSRIEPHLEALTSKVNLTDRISHPVEAPTDKVFEGVVRKPAENPRLILEHREEPHADKYEDSSIRTPLAGYSQQSGHRGLVFLVVIFALLIAGGIVLQQRYGSSIWQTAGVILREKYEAVLQKMHGADTGQVAANSTSQNVIPNTIAESSPTAATTNDAGSLSLPTPSTATPPPSTAESSSAPEPSMTAHAAAPASVEPHDVDTRSNPRSSSRKTHPAYSQTVEKAALDQASSGDDEIGTITVAPALMQANLLASRVPAYPEAAKADHIEGPVVVQAIISKAGVVDYVHVIEGNPRLRSAAAEAVQKWRYKPYLLNGQPVEVATTITVDFKLDR
jgi:TonB family protein